MTTPTASKAPETAKRFDYQAVQEKGRRQAPQSRSRHEDITLNSDRRRKLVATARDHARNYALIGWMLRRHMDYVSRFSPLVKTGNEDLDDYLDRELAVHGKKRNFDVARRHSRNSMMRIFEGLKTLDGDSAMLKIAGGKLQGIESDRIAKAGDVPTNIADRVSQHGLVLDPSTGGTIGYSICRRDEATGMLVHDRIEPSENVVFDGYFGRFDQTRGISPLAAALNCSADLHEAMEWTQMKIKLHSLMGIQIQRAAAEGIADGFPTVETDEADVDSDGVSTTEKTYEFSPNGLTIFDLDPGEKVETVESNTPSSEFIAWTDKTIRQILLALDIPFTAFAGEQSNFSSRIADREEYEKSANEKRERNREVLEEIYQWVIAQWYADRPNFRALCRKAKLSPAEVASRIEWTAAGTPWLDKLKEVNGDAAAIYNGFESRQRICKRRGTDYFDVIDELAEEMAYAKERGVQLAMGIPGQYQLTKSKPK